MPDEFVGSDFSFRLRAGLSNLPFWLTPAVALSLLLFVSAAAKSLNRGDARQEASRTLPQRAVEIASAIERQPQPGRDDMNAWLERVRRESHGAIAWVRVLDHAGEVEARSGAAIARVDWDSDRRILAGQHSYRMVTTPAGDVAVVAIPLHTHQHGSRSVVRFASLIESPYNPRLLEIGALIRSPGEGSEWHASDWMNLLASGALMLLLWTAFARRILLLD